MNPLEWMLPQEADDVLRCSYGGHSYDDTVSFTSLLGSICEGRCSGIKDRAGNPNIQGMGRVEQPGGNTAGNGGEGRNLEELLDSESPAASQLSLVWEWPSFLLVIFLYLIFIPEHKPWWQLPACCTCTGGVCLCAIMLHQKISCPWCCALAPERHCTQNTAAWDPVWSPGTFH